MSVLPLIPDIEATLGDYLRNAPDIIHLGARVSGELPKSFTRPWIKLTQVDAVPESAAVWSPPGSTEPIEHLVRYLVDLLCYAGSDPSTGQAIANLLGRTARAALTLAAGVTFGDLVVTRVTILTDSRVPDQSFDPWRQCRRISAQVWAHAI